MKRQKGKILVALVILCVLAFTFWWGGNAPGLRGWKSSPPVVGTPAVPQEDMPGKQGGDVNHEDSRSSASVSLPAADLVDESAEAPCSGPAPEAGSNRLLRAEEKLKLAASLSEDLLSKDVKGSAEYSEGQGMALDKSTGKDKYLTDPVPEGKPVPVEPRDVVVKDTAYSCTLSVRCDTILQNIKWLDPEKRELVPEGGIIFPAAKVTFYEGESVFNVLMREMKKNKIHLEFQNTPMYNSTYIEGINNLYEFDCGELSGWMYKVNGWFPSYGCSRYRLQDGDLVEWVYTCDLGSDVGGYYATGGES
ncbi:MAG: DUF4430 domain-containing protein [Peptococcaceae bacterium]